MDANRDADGWGALADGTRRAIVACLAEGPRAVGQLAAGLPVSRPAELEHQHIDRHGPGWEAITGGVDGPQGWPLYLDRYAALVKESS